MAAEVSGIDDGVARRSMIGRMKTAGLQPANLSTAMAEATITSWLQLCSLRHVLMIASVVPVALFALEAMQIWLFETALAPNVGLFGQLLLMACFYAAWMSVPVVCWILLQRTRSTGAMRRGVLLAVAALCLSVAHLGMLAAILRVLHSAPGWGAMHWLHSTGEVWLSYGGLWLLVFALTAGGIEVLQRHHVRSRVAPGRYALRHRGAVLAIPLDDIYWVEACGNYVELHTAQGRYVDRKSLATVESLLAAGGFVRAHRSALVNIAHVVAIAPHANSSKYSLRLTDDNRAPLSRRRMATFKAALQLQA